MASFNKFNNNVLRDALIVPILNALTSFFAGLVVFSILGFMAHELSTTVDKVASEGPGLIFIVYPEALAKLPVGPLWSILFFLMMMTLGFGSELSMVETVLTSFQDDIHGFFTNNFRIYTYRITICVICFLLCIPMVCRGGIYILTICDYYICFLSVIFICLMELIVLCWIYGFPRFSFAEDVEMMIGRKLPGFFRFMWRYLTPVTLIILFLVSFALYTDPSQPIGNFNFPYPGWALGLGWLIAIFPVFPVFAWMLYYHCYLGGCDSVREHVQPMVNWGPREHAFRTGRYAGQTQAIAAIQAIQAIRSSSSSLKLKLDQQTPEEPVRPTENIQKAEDAVDDSGIISVAL